MDFTLNKAKKERKKMKEIKYDGRMFDNLVRLKKEINELLVTINAVMNDMTLNKINLKQHKKLEDDMNSYYSELRKLTLN
jgi:plasmid maintenance system killer protein